MGAIAIIILILVVVYGAYQYSNQSTPLLGGAIPVSNVLSHWSHSFRSFAISSELFYGELERMLKEYEMPHSKIERTKHKEAGMLSASRVYLRIKHGDIVFDVCA